MGQKIELRQVKKGGTFRLAGSEARYVRGEYDRSTNRYYVVELGYTDWQSFHGDALVEVQS